MVVHHSEVARNDVVRVGRTTTLVRIVQVLSRSDDKTSFKASDNKIYRGSQYVEVVFWRIK